MFKCSRFFLLSALILGPAPLFVFTFVESKSAFMNESERSYAAHASDESVSIKGNEYGN